MISKWILRNKVLTSALLGCLLGVSCSSAQITLTSSPTQADVFVTPLGEHKPKYVGETPLVTSASELSNAYGGSGPVRIEFRKGGYNTARTLITDIGAVDLSINMDLLPSSGLEDLVKLNSIIDSVFESQRLAKVGRSQDALDKLKEVEKDVPHLAAAYELEGGIYYLQKKYREALDAYSLASNYNPKNPGVIQMRNYLETSLGVQRKEIQEVSDADKLQAAALKANSTQVQSSDTLQDESAKRANLLPSDPGGEE